MFIEIFLWTKPAVRVGEEATIQCQGDQPSNDTNICSEAHTSPSC